MEENKKGKIDFLSLLCLAAIAIITIGFFVGAMIRWQKIENIEENIANKEYGINEVEETIKESDSIEEKSNYNNKIYDDKPYIYTKDTFMIEATEELSYDSLLPSKTELPFINIKNDEVSKINDELQEYYEKTKNSFYADEMGYSFESLGYAYIIKDEILSLSIIFGETYVPSDTLLSIKSFNFDLKNGKVLTNEQLLEKLGFTKEDLKKAINEELKTYYEDYKLYDYNKNLSFEEYLKTVMYSYASKNFDQKSIEYDVGENNFYNNINLVDISINNYNNELCLDIEGIYISERPYSSGLTIKLQ